MDLRNKGCSKPQKETNWPCPASGDFPFNIPQKIKLSIEPASALLPGVGMFWPTAFCVPLSMSCQRRPALPGGILSRVQRAPKQMIPVALSKKGTPCFRTPPLVKHHVPNICLSSRCFFPFLMVLTGNPKGNHPFIESPISEQPSRRAHSCGACAYPSLALITAGESS